MKRIAALVVALLAVLVALAAPAAAHVTVNSPGATAGEEAVLTFRVPCESATASTTSIAVQMPASTPFASVDVLAQPGWTFTTKTMKLATPITNDDGDKITEAVSEIDWTAVGSTGAIKPGEFGEFAMLAGPIPAASSMSFGAVQTYSDATVVRWNEVAAPGSKVEPEHPKPTLLITKAGASTSQAKSTSITAPVLLSIVALVIAAAALGLAAVGNARRRQT